MAEAEKSKIVIASLLKPVDDTRMTEKIGQTLQDTHHHEVHIIGFPSAQPKETRLHLHPLKPFTRLSPGRVGARWRVLKNVLKIRPVLLIITTHELLLTALIVKMLTGCRLIYDVQENYFYNLKYTSAFPFLLRHALALYVRLNERLAAPFIDHFFLAEKGYEQELTFPGKRYTVLENKGQRPGAAPARSRDANQLIFTGTLAETTGVFTAIRLAAALHQLDNRITLTIAGYCAQQSILTKLKDEVRKHPFITLVGGGQLVSHSLIQQLIDSAGAGIISYQANPATERSIPTKLYEYLGASLPILLVCHPAWEELCKPYAAAVVFDPEIPDASRILNELRNQHFYTSTPSDVYWDSEEPKLLATIQSVFALHHKLD
jgi:hypothetical protein